MADIFLSYAREDLDRAKQLAQALEGQGWNVWWDRTIRPGLSFDDVVERELRDAHCVVVLWSQTSVTSRWVKAESMEAADRGSLVPALLERDVRVPVGFKMLQAADLSDWDGSGQHHGFWQLTMALTTLVQPRQPASPEPAPAVLQEKVHCPRCHSVYLDSFIFCPQCGTEKPSAEAAVVDRGLDTVGQLLRKALESQYTVLRELGRGGTAYVFLATDHLHGREVAIKVLRPELMATILKERFVRAAKISRSIQHPHIVPVYTAGIAEGIGFFVMKHMRGQSLEQQMRFGRTVNKVNTSSFLRRLLPIADALAALHDNDIVHRDVKPSNILFDERGSAALADLGLAKMLGYAEDRLLTAPGTVIGTPAYMAPEQYSDQATTGASDQYSFGVILYEALTGEVPFQGPSPQAIIAKHLAGSPVPLTKLAPDVPRSVARVVERMFAKVPEDRFPSMRDASAALENALATGMEQEPPKPAGRWVTTLRALRRWF